MNGIGVRSLDLGPKRAARDARGHEQGGNRYAIIVQSDLLPLSTWLVTPTSTSARPASFRPEIEMTAVRAWTGREACALRAAMRLSIRDFAELLGVGFRTATKWQARGDDVCLRPGTQSVLDTALERASDEARARLERGDRAD